jgi:hypothetical protein
MENCLCKSAVQIQLKNLDFDIHRATEAPKGAPAQEGPRAGTVELPLPPLPIHLGPSLWDGAVRVQDECSTLWPTPQTSVQALLQTHLKVCFTNFLGVPQCSHMDNQN